jgi:hypothetical protein
MLQYCQQHGIKLFTYGSVAGGLLSDKYVEQPKKGLFGELSCQGKVILCRLLVLGVFHTDQVLGAQHGNYTDVQRMLVLPGCPLSDCLWRLPVLVAFHSNSSICRGTNIALWQPQSRALSAALLLAGGTKYSPVDLNTSSLKMYWGVAKKFGGQELWRELLLVSCSALNSSTTELCAAPPLARGVL